MKKILFGLAAMASLTLTACGSDYCDRNEDLAKDLSSKFEECGFDTSATPDEPTDAERDACKEALADCSDDDKEKLDAVLDCIDSVKSCSDKSTTEQTRILSDLVACSTKGGTVSAACAASISAD
ncbi:hypothetical protein HJC22_32505 [Corallococcus exiguus]|uniref:hypothetical protein n=1 Tax=Corallococcus TaxID=83461 RepID=UPI000EA3F2AF|nr:MULTISPECIES: hypothetical protein [Corallococcus]NNC20450.1 hypothetical protein [Corallococcus exiguus]RKH18224.1 hypothetical protein D7V77_34520 [Corallococcus sp. CA041A]RKI06793.1 hypothetical protein D7Y15_29895 [Corallococcus sp. AB030]RUO89855.1 hypothetical protein D7Y11_28045 [Corallococcus sp. AB018]